jgi:peptide/nickel transport system substrate-binding protein
MRHRRLDQAWRGWRSAPFATLLCLTILAGAALLGCAASPPAPPQTETLRLGARETVDTAAVLARFLYAEHLITIDWQGRPQAGLATNWQWDEDGRSLTVQLREGVKFHDGSPFTAQVAVDILRKVQAKDARNLFGAVTRFEAPNSRTLIVRLSRPDAFLVEAIADTAMVDPRKPDIGTGPFKILRRVPSITAEKYTDYYRGEPGINRVEITTYDTQRGAWVALMRGEVDMVQQVNLEAAEFLEGASHVEMFSTLRPYYIPLVFNLRHPILKHVEVRRALVEAINRDEIVREAMRGHGRVADDPVWPFHWAYNNATRKYTYNPNAARLRLDSAGFPVRPPPSAGGMASRFSIHCLFWKDPQWERIALLLQRQLADVGVDLVLEESDELGIRKSALSGSFDTYLFQMAAGKSFDWTYRFWHSPTAAVGQAYQNSGYTGVDSILEQARLRVSRSDNELRAAMADLRERFYMDVPAAFLAWPETTRAFDSRFDVGVKSSPDIFANVWKWRQSERQSASR